MMIYKIALCIFILSAAITAVNDSGLFVLAVPETGVNQIDEATVTDLNDAAASADVNPLFTLSIIAIAAKSLFMGLISIACVLPMLLSLGVPFYLATMIQGPLWFVEAVGIYQLLTGSRMED